jgi:hypothetical protein
MAGEWLKMECATPDKPEVFAITAAMGWEDPDLAVGKLFRVWRWFDQQTTDGNARGVTAALLDRIAGATGFAQAMIDVGWLIVTSAGVELPNFDKHNGATAKGRAQGAKRVANHRSNATCNADTVTDALPREEKKREEKKEPKSKAESATASRLPADWLPPLEFIDFCKTERPDLDPQAVADRFRDHWLSQAGKDGRKADWLATWRNWVRREHVAPSARASPGGYESAKDRSRREAAEKLTGRSNHDQRSPDFIDINEPGSHCLG